MAEGKQLRRKPGQRPRLSDSETQERMLAAGASYVAEAGLSLSLEHLSMEDLIREAGVSRTSSYRRWPTKDAYAADLLVHLARTTRLSDDFTGYASALTEPALDVGLFEAPQGRRDVVVEAMRRLTQADYEQSLASTPWRNYVMLRAAHAGLPDGRVRTEVAQALRETERTFRTHRARALQASAALLGYRLNDPETFDWDAIALLLTATFTGVIVQAFSEPDVVHTTTLRRPFGASSPALWSPAALASANVFFSAAEPDPTITWDAPHLAATRAALSNPGTILSRLWTATSTP